MTTVRSSPSLYGKFIVVVIFLTVFLSLNVSWGGTDIEYRTYIVFGVQIGFLLVGIALNLIRSRQVRLSSVMHPIFLLWLGLFLFSLGSAIMKPDTWNITKQVVLILAPRLLLVFVVLQDESPERTFVAVVKSFVVLTVVSIVLGAVTLTLGQTRFVSDELQGRMYEVAEWSVGPVVSEVGVFRQHGVTRFAAPIASGNPNTIGAVLFTSILLTLGLMMTKEWSISRGGLLLAVQGTALIGTISRTSWVSLLAALVFLTLATTRRMSGIVLRLVVLAICSAVVVVLLANTGAVIQAVEWTTNHGLSGREVFWNIGVEQLRANPLTGIGFGMAFALLSGMSGRAGGLHNTYLQAATEIGLIGLGILVLIMLLPLGLGVYSLHKSLNGEIGIRYTHATRRFAGIAVGCSTIVGITVHSLAESLLFYNPSLGFMWTYLLVATAAMSSSFRMVRTVRH